MLPALNSQPFVCNATAAERVHCGGAALFRWQAPAGDRLARSHQRGLCSDGKHLAPVTPPMTDEFRRIIWLVCIEQDSCPSLSGGSHSDTCSCLTRQPRRVHRFGGADVDLVVAHSLVKYTLGLSPRNMTPDKLDLEEHIPVHRGTPIVYPTCNIFHIALGAVGRVSARQPVAVILFCLILTGIFGSFISMVCACGVSALIVVDYYEFRTR